MELTRSNLNDLSTGYAVIFGQGFETADSVFDQVATIVPSTGAKQGYPFLGATTGFTEWVGSRTMQNLTKHGFEIKNKRFENTVKVGTDEIEDDSYGVYDPMMKQLGEDAKVHPDELIFSVMRNGRSITCYDGQPFFDTDHGVKTRGGSEYSVSNYVDGTAPMWFLLDVTRAVKPFIYQKRRDYRFVSKTNLNDDNVFMESEFIWGVDGRGNAGCGMWQQAFASRQALTAENYEAARAQMRLIKNDNDKPMNIRPSLLVVSPEYESAAKRIVQATTERGGGDNVNVNSAKLLVSSWLA